MSPVAKCGRCSGMHSPDQRCHLAERRYVYADRAEAEARAARALVAFTVAEAAFKAAWSTVLSGLDTVPADAASERAIVIMFDIERELQKIGNVLRGKL